MARGLKTIMPCCSLINNKTRTEALLGGHSNSATSNHPVVDYFPMTAAPGGLFIPLLKAHNWTLKTIDQRPLYLFTVHFHCFYFERGRKEPLKSLLSVTYLHVPVSTFTPDVFKRSVFARYQHAFNPLSILAAVWRAPRPGLAYGRRRAQLYQSPGMNQTGTG